MVKATKLYQEEQTAKGNEKVLNKIYGMAHILTLL